MAERTILYHHLLLITSFCILLCQDTSHHLCMGCKDVEREALLSFKKSLSGEHNLLSSWAWTGRNCCRWRGVGCDNTTGHVIQLTIGTLIRNYDPFTQNYYFLDCPISCTHFDHSLLSLKFLQHLDLSNICFNEYSIPESIGSLTTLKHLDLSNTNLAGSIPPQLGNLTNLQYLNLSGFYLFSDSLKWLSHLSTLQYLDLSGLDLTNVVDWPTILYKLPALSELHLSYCSLHGFHYDESAPHTNLSSIATLDLSYNIFVYNTELDRLLHNLSSSLVHLDLSYCFMMGGPIPHSVGSLFSLKTLILQGNNLNGSIPVSLGRLSQLEMLDLSWNSLQGSIPHSVGSLFSLETLTLVGNNLNGSIPESLGRLSQLEMLDLSWNSLQGSIPSSLFNLCNLQFLDLSDNELAGDLSITGEGQPRCKRYSLETLDLHDNQLTGSLPDWIGQMRNLESLDLSSNSLNGSVSESLGQLSKLSVLDLTNNSLQGVVSDSHFANMTKLETLYLSNNNHLVFNLSSTWVPPFQLKDIDLGSCCKLGPQFPSWLQTQRSIYFLDISDAGITDVVPIWFWNASSGAYYLNISNNQIRGEIPRSLNFLWATTIDLSSNQLRGQLPHLNTSVVEIHLDGNSFSGGLEPILNKGMKYLEIVILSQNHLSGEIPSAICNLGGLVLLDIALNNLSGQIPKCHINPNSSRLVVNLASNYLHGSIPQWMASHELVILRLENNSIQGEIPSFLRNCTSMVILDLGENRLTGNIPSWIGETLSWLVYLRLRSNMLTGTIPPQLSYLSNLQVLDLAQNNLSGSIPHSFKNFTAMAKLNRTLEDIFSFHEAEPINATTQGEAAFIAVVKGREVEYTNTAWLVMILDLSCNGFSGEIPMEIMELVGLQSLNLSENQLVGEIPDHFGGMVELESLDLSRNHLSGAIPKSMTLLFSLSKLNLSYNNLSGEIPTDNQLRTLTNPSIYAGNRDLCGFPLPKCHSNEPSKPAVVAANRIDDSDLSELYLSMGIGYAVGLWGICGIFVFVDSWRIAYFRFLDDMADKFFMAKLTIRRWILFKLQG